MIYWFGSDMKSNESDGSIFDQETYNSDSLINEEGFQIDAIFTYAFYFNQRVCWKYDFQPATV